MKKLFKFLLWLLAILVVLVVALYLTAGIWLRTAVSTLVPQMTKTPASLEKADISLLSGTISLKGFKIGNPEGFAKENAFELGEVFVKFEPKSLLTSKVLINEVKINGTKVDAEISQTGGLNLLILKANIQQYLNENAGKPTTPEETVKPKEKKDSSKAVVVKNLSITDSTLQFALLNNSSEVKLPNMQKENIGEGSKETLPDFIEDIFSLLTNASVAEISKSGKEAINALFDNLSTRSKEAASFGNTLKGHLNNLF